MREFDIDKSLIDEKKYQDELFLAQNEVDAFLINRQNMEHGISHHSQMEQDDLEDSLWNEIELDELFLELDEEEYENMFMDDVLEEDLNL